MKTIAVIITIATCYLPAPAITSDNTLSDLISHDIICFDAEMPPYIKLITEEYGLPKAVVYRWSWAESRHITNAISSAGAYGRFQITKSWLDDYCRYRGKTFPKGWTNHLLNDKENARIALWTFRLWRRLGFTDREIMQCWLFGMRNVFEENRWSDSYDSNIFYFTDRPWRLSVKAYRKYVTGEWW